MAKRGKRSMRPDRKGFQVLTLASLSAALPFRPASAETGILPASLGTANAIDIAVAAGSLAALSFALFAGVGLIRARHRNQKVTEALEADMRDMRARMDQTESLLTSDDQKQVLWPEPGAQPIVFGRLPKESEAPKTDTAFLQFGRWLDTDSASLLDAKIAILHRDGSAFRDVLKTKAASFIEVVGRLAGGKPVVRFRDMTGERAELAHLNEIHERQAEDLETAQCLLEAAPGPAWIRSKGGELIWVNGAYSEAVGQVSREEIIEQGIELLDKSARGAVRKGHATNPLYTGRLPVVANGSRRIFDLTDIETHGGSGGIAVDMTELEVAHADLRRSIDSHERTLNQLQSAVAIFGPDHRLQFYNEAYREMWLLDTAFLEAAPLDSDMLDALRARRQLPEQADFRAWKTDLLSAYRESDGRQDRWHLPDGRIIRVIANPHPQGGVTYVFENITEQMKLESRYNTLAQVQGETLDNLSEGVAVFGSDGRITLWNPSFVRLWKLDEELLSTESHVSAIIDACLPIYNKEAEWASLLTAITGVDERRQPSANRMERTDGTILEYAVVPLPDGGTLVTFTDVTDSVNVERALRDKADALEEAHDIKNTFVQHVSYELRSPLTNIIGFAQLLSEPRTGDLTEKQREYADYILSSSSALLAIINDVLDLATIDAGIMQLELTEIDVEATIDAVIEAVQDRLAEAEIALDTSIEASLAGFVADEKRLRQVLFNLVTNAIRFSDSGCRVEIACARSDDDVVFTVSDDGLGMSREILDSVFGRFVSHGTQNRRRGAGLGLSIVKSFVELHGGTVEIHSQKDKGTTVRCLFPYHPQQTAEQAAE